MIVVARKVEDGAGDNYVSEMIRERSMFKQFYSKIVRRQGPGETAHSRDRLVIHVHAEAFVPRANKVVKISTEPAARIEDYHAGCNAAAQELIKQVDIDLAELLS